MLVERLVELLTTLGFHQANVASPAENDEEKRLRKQATQDFKFFTAVNTAFKEFNATQREHEQVKILRALSEQLEARNKEAGIKRSLDLVTPFLSSSKDIQFRVI